MFNIVIVLVISIIIIFLLSKKTNSNINEIRVINKKLHLLVTLKNEAMIIDEWINHYIWQGVDHFYIIDDGSTDNTKDILNPYIDRGIVSYFYKTGQEEYRQVRNYNEIYQNYINGNCDWLIICDVDEYIYYRGKKVLKDYINSLDQSKISNITLTWKMFGSNGHITHPKSIRTSFLTRKKELGPNVKSICNDLFITKLDVHIHKYTNDINIDNPKELALNHYQIMSKEYFAKVKMTRGDSMYNKHNNIRDWNYFNEIDNNEIYDTELSDLVIKT
jgi:hypothetical protein